MARAAVLLVACLFVLGVTCQNTATDIMQSCTYTDPTGAYYDFTPMIVNLTSSTTKSQLYTGTDVNGYVYYANICNVVSSDTACPTADQTPVCQITPSGTQASSCGVVTSQSFEQSNTTWAPDGGAAVWYTNGKGCNNGVHTNRTSIIHVYCGQESDFTMSSVAEDYCWYEIYISSPYGCPTNTVPSPNAFTGTAQVTVNPAYDTFIHLIDGVDNTGTTVSAKSLSSNSTTFITTTVNGVLNGMFFKTSNEKLYIESVLSSTTYATTMGICTFGVPCDLGLYSLEVVLDSDDDSDSQELPSVCLQGVSQFVMSPGGSATLDDDCLVVTDATQLESIDVIMPWSIYTAQLSDFQFWPSTGKLSYQVTRQGHTSFEYVLQCSVDDDDATCDLLAPVQSANADDEQESLVATVLNMSQELLSMFTL